MFWHGNPVVIEPGMVFFIHTIIFDETRMLAMAPGRLTLRAGDGAAGEVAVAMVSDDTIAVRLADLLDIVGPRMDADHLASLRASSAAQSFVTLDQLRAAELTISYDPVYDELRLHG